MLFACFVEELQKQLLEQVELRKKLEREFQNLKGKLHVAAIYFIWFVCLFDFLGWSDVMWSKTIPVHECFYFAMFAIKPKSELCHVMTQSTLKEALGFLRGRGTNLEGGTILPKNAKWFRDIRSIYKRKPFNTERRGLRF